MMADMDAPNISLLPPVVMDACLVPAPSVNGNILTWLVLTMKFINGRHGEQKGSNSPVH